MSSGPGRPVGGGAQRRGGGAAQGHTAAAAGAPAIAAVTRQRELRQRVDKDVAAMTENFSKMMGTAKVHDTQLRNTQEGFQASVHAVKLIQGAESLLKLVSELKQQVLFSSHAQLNQAVDMHRDEFAFASKQAEEVMEAVAEDAMVMLTEVECLRCSSLVGVGVESANNSQ